MITRILQTTLHSQIIHHTQLRQILAVGIVTQTGPYFFFASALPRLGSSAMATPATEHTAAAAAANTRSLLFELFSSGALSLLSVTFEADALVITTLRREVAVAGSLDRLMAEPRNGEVIAMDAISHKNSSLLRNSVGSSQAYEANFKSGDGHKECGYWEHIHFLIRNDRAPNGHVPRVLSLSSDNTFGGSDETLMSEQARDFLSALGLLNLWPK